MTEESMTGPPVVLILDDEAGSLRDVTLRLLRLRVDTMHAGALDEAILMGKQARDTIEAVVVSPRSNAADVTQLMASLGKRWQGAPQAVVIGPPAPPALREQLVAAGVTRALWTPYDDSTLGYVVRSILQHPGATRRGAARVPTSILGSALLGNQRRDVVLYTLSSSGAYLETPRPFLAGDLLTLEFHMAGGTVRMRARVVHSKTLEDQTRPHLPVGMAVAFQNVKTDDTGRITAFVEAREQEFML
jgi:hypothetical protein